MNFVPVFGDTIIDNAGLSGVIASFSNYDEKGPSVLVDRNNGAALDTVEFADIAKLNGQKIKLLKSANNYNIFSTDGYLPRKFQLPQVGDIISTKFEKNLDVEKVKLHVKNKISKGLFFICRNSSGDELEVLLSEITGIAHTLFSKSKFLSYYADYQDRGR